MARMSRFLFLVVETAKSVEAFDESGHIEGAPFVAYARLAVEHDTPAGRVRYLLPDPDDFSEVMREVGENGDDRVVITPSGTSVTGNMTLAARLYWALRYFGHEDVAVLDGGVAAWRKAGGETTTAPADGIAAGEFTARAAQPEIHVSADDVQAILEDSSATLTDNRPHHLRGRTNGLPPSHFSVMTNCMVYWFIMESLLAETGEIHGPEYQNAHKS